MTDYYVIVKVVIVIVEVLCRRIIKTMMTTYGLQVCLYVFIDISMYLFIISFYRHIDYSI